MGFTCFYPQFESLFKKGQTSGTSSTKPSEHLSYAQFIVQSRSNADAPPREGPSGLPAAEAAEGTNLNQKEAASVSCSPGGHQRVQKTQKGVFNKLDEAAPDNSTKNNQGTCSDPNHLPGPKPVGSGSSIVVSPRQVGIKIKVIDARSPSIRHRPLSSQRGNPVLKYIRSVPWEFGDVVPDYVLGPTTCALFLRYVNHLRLIFKRSFTCFPSCSFFDTSVSFTSQSLRYHNLNPNYIHDRLKHLGQTFTLRVLLVQVDVVGLHNTFTFLF